MGFLTAVVLAIACFLLRNIVFSLISLKANNYIYTGSLFIIYLLSGMILWFIFSKKLVYFSRAILISVITISIIVPVIFLGLIMVTPFH